MRLFIILIFFFAYSIGFCQDQNTTQTIFMKAGFQFPGEVIDYSKNFFYIKTQYGGIVKLNKNRIERIVKTEDIEEDIQNSFTPLVSPKNFEKRGLYNVSYGSYNSSESVFNENMQRQGLGLHHTVGHQYSQYFGVGLGIGFQNMDSGQSIIPITLNLRGYLREHKISPYYNIAAGYAAALKNEDKNIVGAKGGFIFHPALGFRIGSAANAFNVDFGVQWVRSSFTTSGIRGGEIEQTFSYNPFVFRVGVSF